jgi:hypothetical protein
MVNPLVSPMVIAAKIHKYFRRFENAGATQADKSKTLLSLGLHEGLLFNRLIRNRVFIESAPGYYYVSRENYDRYRSVRRRRAFIILGGLVLFLVLASYFYSR